MDAALQKELFDLARTVLERLSSAPVVLLVVVVLFRNQFATLLNAVSGPFSRVVESFLSRGFKVGLDKGRITLEAEAAVIAQEKVPPDLAKGLIAIEEKHSRLIPATEKSTDSESSSTDRLQAVRNIDVPPITVEQQQLIRADLTALGISQREQVELLIKHLATTQLWLRAEITYRTIFGSQIALLKFLNLTGPATRAQFLAFYDNAKLQFPDLYARYSFEEYLNYLLSRGLIAARGPEQYSISVAGKEFLKWMTETSLTDVKPF